ncbi:hypothetical protein [Bradyrhizobium sp. BR 1433]
MNGWAILADRMVPSVAAFERPFLSIHSAEIDGVRIDAALDVLIWGDRS